MKERENRNEDENGNYRKKKYNRETVNEEFREEIIKFVFIFQVLLLIFFR
jgi:hypothetical protein